MTSSELTNGKPSEPIPTEVREKPKRRVYTSEYKRKIIAEIDAAPRGGKALILRREGLWAASVDGWRKELSGSLELRKRGRKPSPDTPLKHENEKLRRQIERLETKLEHAALIIAAQKKVARLFEQMNENDDAT